jgi:peptidylprolyl isomerase
MKTFLAVLVALAILGFTAWNLSVEPATVSINTEAAKQAAAAFAAEKYSADGQIKTSGLVQMNGGEAAPSQDVEEPSHATMPATQKIMNATLHTNKGDITIEFFDTDAPNTVANFVKLAQNHFYDGVKFHRVIKGFMIQGGDPLTKDDAMQARWGTGGPGYTFADEIRANNHNEAGTISMANAGPNTNGSQFFINVANNSFLDGKHTTFGRVTTGMDVVEAIEGVATNENDRPLDPVVINSVSLQ